MANLVVNLDDELAQDFLSECREHLTGIEADLLSIEKSGAEVNLAIVDRASRSLRWVQGGAGLFDLRTIRDLAQQMAEVLGLFGTRKLTPTAERIRPLLGAVDRLRNLVEYPAGVEDPARDYEADFLQVMAALTAPRHLRVLLVEDDFSSRLLLQTFLSSYGECHIAVNGREAVDAFRSTLEHGQKYDLICMDIMMPEMDGPEAVRRIRALEEEFGILSTLGAKIIMTTAADDIKDVVRCFHELCDSYLTKPVDRAHLIQQMREHQLIS